jgi:hypothetical protein
MSDMRTYRHPPPEEGAPRVATQIQQVRAASLPVRHAMRVSRLRRNDPQFKNR